VRLDIVTGVKLTANVISRLVFLLPPEERSSDKVWELLDDFAFHPDFTPTWLSDCDPALIIAFGASQESYDMDTLTMEDLDNEDIDRYFSHFHTYMADFFSDVTRVGRTAEPHYWRFWSKFLELCQEAYGDGRAGVVVVRSNK